jgi:hypothetical protein
MTERSKKAAATHIPILIALSELTAVKTVIEFGSGLYSTPLFLDRSIFPNLDVLCSHENDKSWVHKIKRRCKDRRLGLVEVEGPIHSVAAKTDFSTCDICFIDDSVAIADRAKTIEAVAMNLNAAGITTMSVEPIVKQRNSLNIVSVYCFKSEHGNCLE